MRHLAVLVVATLLAAGQANAETERVLRVVGETSAPPPGVPSRFVIDAVIETGDDPFKAEVEGWMATIGEDVRSDEIEGTCVEGRCALSMSYGNDKLAISADLAGPGAPGPGRVIVTDGEGTKIGEAPVRFATISGPVAGLGELARPDAIRSAELSDLLMWNGSAPGFSNVRDEPIDWMERRALSDWQASAGRPGGGLVLVEDLTVLRARADAAKAALGWTPIRGPGWRAGYPATLMPRAEQMASGQKYASPDGAQTLVIGVDRPMSDEAWDAYVDQITEDKPGIERRGYTRVNDDMEINWIEEGRMTSASYHNRETGLARLEYTRPEDEASDSEIDLATILQRSFRVEEAPN